MNCRICHSKMKKIDEISCIKGHARLGDEPFEIPMVKIGLFHCSNCNHVQTNNFLDDNYYDDYEGREYGESCYYANADAVYSRRIKKLYALNSGKSILDIGCGTGFALISAKRWYKRCVGVEPSEHDCKIAREKGISVIHSYFDTSLQMDEKFDAIMCNMLLEHVDDPGSILNTAYKFLNEGGVLLVGIPDGEKIVNQGIYHQFLEEHINYYSIMSFMKLAYDCGFDIIEWERDERLLELNFYLRKRGGITGKRFLKSWRCID